MISSADDNVFCELQWYVVDKIWAGDLYGRLKWRAEDELL